MAGSRLEKFGTVYSRVRDLMRAGVMKEKDKPIWFDVYAAFPPKSEPLYVKPKLRVFGKVTDPVPDVFYKEDAIRAKFFKVYGSGPKAFELSKTNFVSPCQRFVVKYQELEAQGHLEEQDLFEGAGRVLLSEGIILRRRGVPMQRRDAGADAKPDISADISADADVSADASADADVSADASADAKPDVSADISADAKPDVSADASADADVSADASTDADISADASADAKPDVSADISADAKPDAKPDVNADISADAKPEVSADISADASADVSADAKPDAKPNAEGAGPRNTPGTSS